MDNFISNIKNRLMLPGSQEANKEERHIPNIPMPDIDDMTASASIAPTPKQDVSPIQHETRESTPGNVSSKPSLNVLLKKFSSDGHEKKKEDDQPQYIPNPIEDDIFIYYD